MMYVETELKPSSIHGLGVFALKNIPKGTLVWKFTPGFDQRFTKQELEILPARTQLFLLCAGYTWTSRKSNLLIFAADNGRYINHSKNNNIFSEYCYDEPEVISRAIRNIKAGEELTEDYGSFETGWTDDYFNKDK